MRCTPIRHTPMRHIPMRHTSMGYTPMRRMPMKCISMRCVPIRCTPVTYTPVCDVHACIYEMLWWGQLVTSPLWVQELSSKHLLEIARTHADRQQASFLPKRISKFCFLIVAMPSQSYSQPFGVPLSLHNARLRGIRRRWCTSGRYASRRCTSLRTSLPVNVYEIYGNFDFDFGKVALSDTVLICRHRDPN